MHSLTCLPLSSPPSISSLKPNHYNNPLFDATSRKTCFTTKAFLSSTKESILKDFRERTALKIITGLQNFDKDNVASVVTAAEKGGATHVDIACDPELVKLAISLTSCPVCVSSVNPASFPAAVEAGALMVEIGNYDSFHDKGMIFTTKLNPHLSDCGLASYIPNAEQILNHNVGSGYDAPEVALSGQYTFKSDIYSFGVVMLELLSGRKPFDSSRARPDQSLVRWATPQLHDIDALAKMVDPALKGLYPVKSLSRFADVIALCAQPEPEFRPPMSEVVQALVRLVQRANMSRRTTFGSDHGGSLRGSDDPAIRDVQIGT